MSSLACRVALIAAAAATPAIAAPDGGHRHLADAGLEELAATPVATVTRRTRAVSHTPAAVYVITRDEIRRSGATSVPELLRLVPGLHVARLSSSEWAISARGFTSRWANKLLVLVDGRTVYTPLFSGVRWDAWDVLVEDIERIEVIRGPGATMWGANAVNGVISIVTRSAVDTQGDLVVAGGGTSEQGHAVVRHGGRIGSQGFYRVYGRAFRRVTQTASGDEPWNGLRSGAKVEFRRGADTLTFLADALSNRGSGMYNIPPRPGIEAGVQSLPVHQDSSAASVHWRRIHSDSAESLLHVSFDTSDRNDSDLGELRRTLDIDFQSQAAWRSRHDLVWGMQARTSTDDIENRPQTGLLPPRRRYLLGSVFLQDQIALVPERLYLTAGIKLEALTFVTGVQKQPSLQLLWTPTPRHTTWFSNARALRTPSRGEREMYASFTSILQDGVFVNGRVLPRGAGGEPEQLVSFEAGQRYQRGRLTVDATGFVYRYDHLRSAELDSPFLETVLNRPVLVLPVHFANLAEGDSYGFEAFGRWDWKADIRLTASYSFLNLEARRKPGSTDMSVHLTGGETPRHHGRVSLWWDATRRVSFDPTLYLVDRLPASGIAGYGRLDVHSRIRVSDSIDVDLMCNGLYGPKHSEFWSVADRNNRERGRFGRGVYASLGWRR